MKILRKISSSPKIKYGITREPIRWDYTAMGSCDVVFKEFDLRTELLGRLRYNKSVLFTENEHMIFWRVLDIERSYIKSACIYEHVAGFSSNAINLFNEFIDPHSVDLLPTDKYLLVEQNCDSPVSWCDSASKPLISNFGSAIFKNPSDEMVVLLQLSLPAGTHMYLYTGKSYVLASELNSKWI